VLFSRCEYSLKRIAPKAGLWFVAEPNWDKFADDIANPLTSIDEAQFLASRNYLVNNPPARLLFKNNALRWDKNPKRPGESDARYWLRLCRDVRNNLFHGGKFEQRDENQMQRDRELIRHADRLLRAAFNLREGTKADLGL
jgi:hypothetical protein